MCDECEDTGYITCGSCNGSGEGIADGTTCYNCNGKGVEKCSCQHEYDVRLTTEQLINRKIFREFWDKNDHI